MADAIHQEVFIGASPERIYRAYMNADEHSTFTGGGKTEINASDGGAFSCHDGMITGRNVELVPGSLIVQAWRAANWEPGRYSVVRIAMEPAADGTNLTLDQEGFPEGEKNMLEGGWQQRYWEPLRQYLANS